MAPVLFQTVYIVFTLGTKLLISTYIDQLQACAMEFQKAKLLETRFAGPINHDGLS